MRKYGTAAQCGTVYGTVLCHRAILLHIYYCATFTPRVLHFNYTSVKHNLSPHPHTLKHTHTLTPSPQHHAYALLLPFSRQQSRPTLYCCHSPVSRAGLRSTAAILPSAEQAYALLLPLSHQQSRPTRCQSELENT